MAQTHPDFEQGSNENVTESMEGEDASENSDEVRYMAERRMNSRTLCSVTRRETEMARLQEVHFAAERKRKGKGLAPPPVRRSARKASKTIVIEEPSPPTIQVSFAVMSESEDEATASEEGRTDDDDQEYGVVSVEIDAGTEAILMSFDDEEDMEIYKQKTESVIKNRTHQIVHLPSLDVLGARTRFIKYLYKIGFVWFMNLKIDAVPLKLAQEFFTTFRLTTTTDLDKPSISFRMFCMGFEMSLTEWAVRLGVVTAREAKKDNWRKLERGVPGKHVNFDGQAAWRRITRPGAEEFSANTLLGADIVDPALRLVHIYLGFNLFGQGSSITKVSLTELYFTWKI